MKDIALIQQDSARYAQALELLSTFGLPTTDLDETTQLFGFPALGRVEAVVGFQPLDQRIGLLRSLAVQDGRRNKRLGKALCDYVIAIASDKGINDVYLVTDTAERYFVRQGYRSIDRRSAPEALRDSTQFAQVCPDTATVMHKNIIRTNVSPTVVGK